VNGITSKNKVFLQLSWRKGAEDSRILGFKGLFSKSFILAIRILSFCSMIGTPLTGGNINRTFSSLRSKYLIRLVNMDVEITYTNSAQLS
jgi:hypothetical protein